tara:strand:- start:1928 stop:2401 length:474 start_codon:yes stop_codon:yes gene_type:complete
MDIVRNYPSFLVKACQFFELIGADTVRNIHMKAQVLTFPLATLYQARQYVLKQKFIVILRKSQFLRAGNPSVESGIKVFSPTARTAIASMDPARLTTVFARHPFGPRSSFFSCCFCFQGFLCCLFRLFFIEFSEASRRLGVFGIALHIAIDFPFAIG